MRIFEKIYRNIFWLIVEFCFRLGANLVISAVIARQLGVEQYGIFQYAIGLTLAFSALSFVCGGEVLIPKLVHADTRETKQLLGNAFLLRLAFSVMAYISLITFSIATEELKSTRQLIAVLGLSILTTESFSVVTAWLQSQTNNRPKSILTSLIISIKLALIFFLYSREEKSPVNFAQIWAVEALLIATGLAFIYKKQNKEFFFCFDIRIICNLWKEGLPFYLGLLAAYFFLRLDFIMLKIFGNPYDLGLYASAIQLLSVITAFSAILVSSMAPLMIYRHESINTIQHNMLIMTGLVVGFAAFSAALANFFAPWAVPILFGEKFNQAIPVFRTLAWISILYFLDAALNVFLVKIKKGKLIIVKWLAAIIFALPSYFMLIPKYHAYGAITGSYIGYAVACFLGVYYFFRHRTNAFTSSINQSM